jgi:hypothetical protein
MTVYVVASRRRVGDRVPGFLELWARAIKGRYDHVEITFVRNRDVFACYLLRNEGVAKIKHRDYDKLRKDWDFFWFILPNLAYQDELILEKKCRDMVASGRYVFSYYRMVMSAFPSERNEALLRYILKFVEPPIPPAGEAEEEYKERFQEEAYDEKHWRKDGAYCASLCAEILGISDPLKRTAEDIVEICKDQHGAREVEQPIPYSELRTKDEADIPRATRVVVYDPVFKDFV